MNLHVCDKRDQHAIYQIKSAIEREMGNGVYRGMKILAKKYFLRALAI